MKLPRSRRRGKCRSPCTRLRRPNRLRPRRARQIWHFGRKISRRERVPWLLGRAELLGRAGFRAARRPDQRCRARVCETKVTVPPCTAAVRRVRSAALVIVRGLHHTSQAHPERPVPRERLALGGTEAQPKGVA